MSLKVKLSIEFPCSKVEWEKLLQIKQMFSALQVGEPIKVTEILSSPSKSLSNNEIILLDEMAKFTNQEGSTPLLDFLDGK